jgi:hypothetical protein
MTGSMPCASSSRRADVGQHGDDAEDQRGHPLQADRLAQEHRGQQRRRDRIHRDHHRAQHRGCPEQQCLVDAAELHGLDEQPGDEDVPVLRAARPAHPGR